MHTLCALGGRPSWRRLCPLALLSVLACLPVWAQAPGCYLGAYIEQDPVLNGDIDLFEQLVGKKHASYMCYLGYGEPFPAQWVAKVLQHGALPQIAWEPNNGLGEVADDPYLRGFAQAAAQAQGPILLRFASEMNGTWMAYSGSPDDYVRTWRLVYQIIKQAAPQVIMTWCPFATPRRTIPLYYPGDDYVDWVGVNIYAVVYNNGDVTQPAPDGQIANLRYIYDLYGAHKPIAVCEYAATHYCTASQQSSADFAVHKLQEMYQAVARDFPNVVLLNWFSVDVAQDGLAANDYAVTTDSQVLQAYREAIGGEYFLAQLPPPGLALAAAPRAVPEVPETPVPLALTGNPAPRTGQVLLVVKGAQPAALTGAVTIEALVGADLPTNLVEFYVDDHFLGLTNVAPYYVPWNAAQAAPGVHVLRVVVRDTADAQIASHEAAVVIPTPGQ